MALHEQCVGETDEWYTPPHVFDSLGCKFDTDVASPGASITPWIPARRFITRSDEPDWVGLVWMNPPFGARNGLVPWLDRFFRHGNGIALVPDRTSAPWWQTYAPLAGAILFVSPKLKFIGADGNPGKSPAQGTSLFAVGRKSCDAFHKASRSGLGVLMLPKDTNTIKAQR
jgi:hypothetical protein